jgi:RNA polymerase sigma factor (sigma-70 family)
MRSPDPLPAHALLFEHQAFLHRLARSLVADPQRAEDLAQDVALLALSHPPRPTGSVRGWFARVLRNRAVSVARSEGRRSAHEALVPAPESPRTPPEIEAHFQVQRRVVEAVERLEEPYRGVILLRYDQDLPPSAIAERLGVPLSTVKTRLARGLARLRDDLDEHDVHGMPAWSIVLLGGFSDTQRTAVTTALAAEGAVMTVKLAWTGSIVAVAALSGTWWMLHETLVPGAPSSAVAFVTAAPGGLVTHEEGLLTAAGDEARDARTPLPTGMTVPPEADESTAWSLDLALSGWSADDTGPISIAVFRPRTDEPVFAIEHALADTIRLDLGALFADGGARPGQFRVRLDHPAHLPADVGVLVPRELLEPTIGGGRLEAEIELVRAKAIVTGSVAVTGQPPAGPIRAAIFALKDGWTGDGPIDHVTPDEQGRFRLRADHSQRHVLVAHVDCGSAWHLERSAPEHRPATRLLDLELGQSLEVPPLVLDPGASIEGWVESTGGGVPPVGSVSVMLEGGRANRSDRKLLWLNDQFENEIPDVPWGADGRFRIRGLGPNKYMLNAAPARSGPHVLRVTKSNDSGVPVVAPASGVRLSLGKIRVTIEARGQGLPIAGAGIGVYREENDEDSTNKSWVTSKADDKGQQVVEIDPRDDLNVFVDSPLFPRKEVRFQPIELVPNALLVVDLDGQQVEAASLIVRIVAERDSLPSDTLIDLRLFDLYVITPEELELSTKYPNSVSGSSAITTLWPRFALRPKRTDAPGSCALEGLRAGRYLVHAALRAPEGEPPCVFMSTSFEVTLEAGARLEHSWTPEVGGVVRMNLSALASLRSAALRSATGDELPLRYQSDGPTPGTRRQSPSAMGPGVFTVYPPLAAGDYVLDLSFSDGSTHRLSVYVLAGQVNDVVIGPDDV